MKAFLKLFYGLFFVAMMAVFGSSVLGVSMAVAGSAAFGLAVVQSFAAPYMSVGFMAGVLQELWTGELIHKFRHSGTFMEKIPSMNQFVNNDVIHMSEIGADPDVLINNNTYPIANVQRTDDDVTVSLDKYDTENTKITDDELYALPYDKEGSAIRQHREALEEATIEKSLHALCPIEDTAETPVIATTGDSNGAAEPRKRLKPADIVAMKKKFDDLKVPKRDRVLVLNNDHVEDLLLTSENFEKNYVNKDIVSGRIMNMYGFEIHELSYNPVFDSATGEKKAYGAAAAAATDQNASVAFYAGRAGKATGSVKMYRSLAQNDPENRQTLVGFGMRHIAFPKSSKGFGAIISGMTV